MAQVHDLDFSSKYLNDGDNFKNDMDTWKNEVGSYYHYMRNFDECYNAILKYLCDLDKEFETLVEEKKKWEEEYGEKKVEEYDPKTRKNTKLRVNKQPYKEYYESFVTFDFINLSEAPYLYNILFKAEKVQDVVCFTERVKNGTILTKLGINQAFNDGSIYVQCLEHYICDLSFEEKKVNNIDIDNIDNQFIIYEKVKLRLKPSTNLRPGQKSEFYFYFPKNIETPLCQMKNLNSIGLFLSALVKNNPHEGLRAICSDSIETSGLYALLELWYNKIEYFGIKTAFAFARHVNELYRNFITNIGQYKFYYLSYINSFFFKDTFKENVSLLRFISEEYPKVLRDLFENHENFFRGPFFKKNISENREFKLLKDYLRNDVILTMIPYREKFTKLKNFKNVDESDLFQRNDLYAAIFNGVNLVIDTRSVLNPEIAVLNKLLRSVDGYETYGVSSYVFNTNKHDSPNFTIMKCAIRNKKRNNDEYIFTYVWMNNFSKEFHKTYTNKDYLNAVHYLFYHLTTEAPIQTIKVALIRDEKECATVGHTLYATLLLIFSFINEKESKPYLYGRFGLLSIMTTVLSAFPLHLQQKDTYFNIMSMVCSMFVLNMLNLTRNALLESEKKRYK